MEMWQLVQLEAWANDLRFYDPHMYPGLDFVPRKASQLLEEAEALIASTRSWYAEPYEIKEEKHIFKKLKQRTQVGIRATLYPKFNDVIWRPNHRFFKIRKAEDVSLDNELKGRKVDNILYWHYKETCRVSTYLPKLSGFERLTKNLKKLEEPEHEMWWGLKVDARLYNEPTFPSYLKKYSERYLLEIKNNSIEEIYRYAEFPLEFKINEFPKDDKYLPDVEKGSDFLKYDSPFKK